MSWSWSARARLAALLLAVGAPWACSLIATFDDRPDAAAGAGASGGHPPVELVAAFPLGQCQAAPDASPLGPGSCDYRDESCAGFADFDHLYTQKATGISDGVSLACDPGALVAYEVAADETAGTKAELRVLAREREGGGGCTDAIGAQRVVLIRLDARTLALIEKVPIEVSAPSEAPAPPPDALVFGRSERRLVAAYRGDDPGSGASKVFVLSMPLDRAPASATPVSSTWSFHLAAKLPAPAAFAAARASAVDDVGIGKVYVAVESQDGGPPPVFTIGDEEIGEEVPFTSLLRFTNGNLQPSRAELFPRSVSKTDDAGLLVERIGPGAVSQTREAPRMTVTSNQVIYQGLSYLRWLPVPGAGPPTGRAEPWYAAAALFPERPGAGFGVQPVHVRLEAFGFEGRMFAQLRGCAIGDDKACTLPAKSDGGVKDLDLAAVPDCADAVELAGAFVADDPDAASNVPKIHAVCDLGAGVAGSGRVVWHRDAGGFGAAVAATGDTLWVVRPGGGALVGGKAMMRLGDATPVGPGGPLAAGGPLSIAFVDGLGWVVAAVDDAQGRLWTRRFGCATGS